MTVYSPDDNDTNADWSKTTWDLPKTVAGLSAFLLGQAELNERTMDEEWRAFLARPSATSMPPGLRSEMEALIYGGLPVTMAENTPRQVGDGGATGTD